MEPTRENPVNRVMVDVSRRRRRVAVGQGVAKTCTDGSIRLVVWTAARSHSVHQAGATRTRRCRRGCRATSEAVSAQA